MTLITLSMCLRPQVLLFLCALSVATSAVAAPDDGRLPSTASLKDVKLQVPLRVYSRDGKLIAEYGEMRRVPLKYKDIPQLMVKAVVAAEDDRFFQHSGVDFAGLARAAVNLALTREKSQGGSTITMQLARNFYLTSEKTYSRKLNEIKLAYKIESELSKEEILELYLNKIYLGNRAYGVGAAAHIYYGKELKDLSLAQLAMMAGLPKAPSKLNPIANPQRALERRNYVLARMHKLGYITTAQYNAARAERDRAALHLQPPEVEAQHVGEMVRAALAERYGEAVYTAGYRAYTTLDSSAQIAAEQALRKALRDYDKRHGYRGAEGRVRLPARNDAGAWQAALKDYDPRGGLLPAAVTRVESRAIEARLASGAAVRIDREGMAWARTAAGSPSSAADVAKIGDVIRVERDGKKWRLAQLPQVEGAFVAMRPEDGAILALVGGFDFGRSKFNRATQAVRQPGSSFKPLLYAAALDKGYTPATLLNDAPVMLSGATEANMWRPENYDGQFNGPTRLREALTRSLNMVSIRLLQDMGIDYALEYATSRFDVPAKNMPRNLSLALGSGSVTPLQLVRAYAVFANGGYRVTPYVLERVEDARGRVLMQNAKNTPARVLAPSTAYLMTSMMQDVIRRGTARGALSLGRGDLAGKTGTTNDQRDAWFCGYNGDVAAVAWVGFDDMRPLGADETGGRTALPMWTAFMNATLKGKPEHAPERPGDIVTVRIDPFTGTEAPPDMPGAIPEVFAANNPPPAPLPLAEPLQADTVYLPEKIF